MVRELVITLYLSVFRAIFIIFKQFPQKKKTTFVASFGENILYTVHELEKQTNDQVVILKTSQCKTDFGSEHLTLNFETSSLTDWIRSVYHLATSEKVFIDNYFGFLAAAPFKSNVACIQLWHAAGAIKQFGSKDPAIVGRSKRAHERFNEVYQQFDHVVVGSDQMASIFRDSFNLPEDRMLRTGVPRTDFFFDETARKKAEQTLAENYPVINEKKVILYAPTYRDNQLNSADLALEMDKMYQKLKDKYVLFLRLHPAVNADFQNKYPGFVINVSSYPYLNHLLTVTDLLITDYSSIPFEFALLNKPMVFFAYDLDRYTMDKGFWTSYEDLVPGPVAETTRDLVSIIETESFDMSRVRRFAHEWNKYSQGKSSERLIKAIYTEDEQTEFNKEFVNS
ncbi:CDP-glycerol glycerophosphotransferase, TagB/SpsB family [Lentibacillus persicus]|uniref:CDP-glycerol glycerophosphotransferase, TagB/SpsB family n=1 Tax=Lentibacillus persicus TaxID=640948 RepID=A0A1I1XUP8_9BACI|nr:CDP-glycerol glycerophosphotransferase family protein [Lentibacillus persicus]SFE11056.1 CDP-glycerol glycerophosphotransferase, TagB/SpsB family [Lentibacillus persicus]